MHENTRHNLYLSENTVQALLTLKSTKQLSMRYVEWGGIVGTYSSGGNSRQKAWNPPNGDYNEQL